MARAAPYDRERALDAAMTLFWDKGFHATSLKDLEGTLSMKPGSIYAAFKSKENLYLLALQRYSQTFRGRFQDQIAQAPSPLRGLADHLRGYGRMSPADAARQACMLVKTFIDTRTTEPAIAQQARTYLDAMRAEFVAAFQAAQEQGEIAADADVARLARRFQGYLNALRMELHQGAGQSEVAELAEDFARDLEAQGR